MNKLIQWTTLHLVVLFSPALFALGLGGAQIESYLERPLDVRIELISNSDEELQSMTVGLASVQDFELLGMSRAAIMVPLEFEVVTDSPRPYIHVTSKSNVTEPVVQVLVEVIWASGRMLREYTLFLDPPTFDSPAPPAVINTAPKSAGMPPEQESMATVQRTPVTPEPPQPQSEPEPVNDVVESASDQSVSDPDRKPAQATNSDDVEDSPAVEESQQQSRQPEEPYTNEEVYGPVARGETLWGIASDFSRGSGYSVNQTMLALQRKNPDAFINNNINSLKRGAILRMPALSEVGELSSRQALVEVLRQEEEKRTGISQIAPAFSAPTVADIGDYQETAAEDAQPVSIEEEPGHLELVPPAEEETLDSVASEETVTQEAGSEDFREELSRSEEELVNVKQENQYLEQRIQELESKVAEQQEQAIDVEDSDMAAMETRLAADRASAEQEPPVAITPGGEAQPWYAGRTPLIVGAAVILIALIVWILRRRSAGQTATAGTGAVAVKAGDTLKSAHKHGDGTETVVQKAPVSSMGPEPEPDISSKSEPTFTDVPLDEGETVVQKVPEGDSGFAIDFAAADDDTDTDTDTDVDTETSDDDPEIKLDLARAYLSLGDKEASKAMLDEVLRNGNDAQKAEAKQMLDEF